MKEPGATENPNLNTGGQITMLPSKMEGWHLRLTVSRPSPDINLWSAALAPNNLAEGNSVHMRTGSGFMALKFGDKEEFHLRPALVEEWPSFPETHVNELKRAIDLTLSGSPDRQKYYKQELGKHGMKVKSRET